jgi:hypothetical protein
MDAPVVAQIIQKLKQLPNHLQRQVLIFVDALQISSIRGQPGKNLLFLAGSISSEDLTLMQQTIESGCEQVDSDEW